MKPWTHFTESKVNFKSVADNKILSLTPEICLNIFVEILGIQTNFLKNVIAINKGGCERTVRLVVDLPSSRVTALSNAPEQTRSTWNVKRGLGSWIILSTKKSISPKNSGLFATLQEPPQTKWVLYTSKLYGRPHWSCKQYTNSTHSEEVINVNRHVEFYNRTGAKPLNGRAKKCSIFARFWRCIKYGLTYIQSWFSPSYTSRLVEVKCLESNIIQPGLCWLLLLKISGIRREPYHARWPYSSAEPYTRRLTDSFV